MNKLKHITIIKEIIIQYYKIIENFQVSSSKETWQMEKYQWVWNDYMSY